MKNYSFRTFERAMEFMQSAVPFINDMNHHPRWENIFSTVVVWLTSWDIGFKPSRADIELAQQLDALYRAANES
jgi:pterin-4a-carbinolamine dehydratase